MILETKRSNQIGQVFRLAPCLNSSELLVLLALADYGFRIFPSQKALSAKTRLHISTVKRAVASLRRKQVIRTEGHGKALTYVLHLAHAERGTSLTESEAVAHDERGGSSQRARDPNYQTNHQTNPLPADAGRGVESPWDGIDPEDQRRIRRWCGHHDADELCAAQRRVTLRRLGDLRLRVTDHGRWWTRLGAIWAESGVPPYQTLKAELDAIGPNVRDRTAVLAFRLGIGKVAA